MPSGLGTAADGWRPHALALTARPHQRILYCGFTALITDLDGEIARGDEGLYFRNTRLLSRSRMRVCGRSPDVVVEAAAAPHASLGYVRMTDLPGLPGPLLIERARFAGAGLLERLRLTLYAPGGAARVDLALELDGDFADLIEAQKGERRQRAPVERRWDGARRELTIRYLHPRLDRAVVVRVEAEEVEHVDGVLRIGARVAADRPAEVLVSYEPLFEGRHHRVRTSSYARPDGPTAFASVALRAEAPRLETASLVVASAWRTAVDDLSSLPLGEPCGPALPIAGVPLYQQLFGRDTLAAGIQAAMAMPTLLRDALYVHASWQGRRDDPASEEEPGRILHQARRGPTSELGLDPFARFYGEYTGTAAFLIAARQYLAWTGDAPVMRSLLPAVRAAARWIVERGDRDGDGLLEYAPTSGALQNEGWKDSDDAIVTEAGEVLRPPIATCEIQGYACAALRDAASVLSALGSPGEAAPLLRAAGALRARLDRAFWMPDRRFYGLAVGPDKRLVRSIASNPLHLLAVGVVPRDRAEDVARRLLAPDLFTGWGIRTLSADHPRFDPFSYHLGSVWPAETSAAAIGFARYGLVAPLHAVAEGAFAAAELFTANRLPEVLGGVPRDEDHPHPGFYRGSNQPQAWSAGSVLLIVQALLGVRPAAAGRELRVDPQLPPWLPWVKLDGLRVGTSRLDLEFWRDRRGRSRFRVAARAGPVRVVHAPLGSARGRSALAPDGRAAASP